MLMLSKTQSSASNETKLPFLFSIKSSVILVIILQISIQIHSLDQTDFDDSVLFRMTWSGSIPNLPSRSDIKNNVITMTTTNNEKYHCILPEKNIKYEEYQQELPYVGKSALELLQPLFTQSFCSYRFETYWTYKLCHGRHVKQYHDEKDVTDLKKIKRQEFYLGHFKDDIKALIEAEKMAKEKDPEKVIPVKKIESQSFNYYEIIMTDGTPCDLKNRPRITRVKYICYPDSNNDILSVEEILSCEYEMVVLTTLLCEHLDYRSKELFENEIKCHSVGDSADRPIELEKLELEKLQTAMKAKKLQIKNYLKKQKEEKELHETIENILTENIQTVSPNDRRLMDDFLEGRHCLYGGSGWWKFEFCNGKKVIQYHEYEDKKRIEIILGTWNKDRHLSWIEENPHKKPKKGTAPRKTALHLYSEGTMCDQTGKPRQVEVKIKCKESSDHPNAVSLLLMEPKTCEYILVVESSILCPLIEQTDDGGLFPDGSLLDVAKKVADKNIHPEDR